MGLEEPSRIIKVEPLKVEPPVPSEPAPEPEKAPQEPKEKVPA